MKRLVVAVVFLVIFVPGILLWWNHGLEAPGMNKTPVIFVVKNGEGVRSIANRLKEEQFIKDPIVFFLLTKKLGIDGQIQAGDFRVNRAMTAEELARALTHGTLDIWVTIPEGKRAAEIAAILKEKLPTYQDSWKQVLEDNEGFLFPDTYLIPHDASAQTVIQLMRNTFETRYTSILPNPGNSLTKDQIVTLASLIEREAKLPQDRPLVASVIMNRLSLGMALQIDATVQYALGYQAAQQNWWKKNLDASDLATPSSFNTYKNTGLPPHPIANPGLSALQAAINPAKTDYLYYISDKSGQNHYARMLSEHQANIQRYGL